MSSLEQKWKVAFIGCGQRARVHANALKEDGRCKVVALADINREAAEAFNQDYGFEAPIYTNHIEMLQQERPDVVIASLWTRLHLPVFKDCTEYGVKAVLSEKPMAPTYGECLEMFRIAEETGCQLTFCHQRRFALGNLIVRQLIEEGHFGEIQRMDLYSPRNLLDCGTHIIDHALSFNKETGVKWVLGAADTSNHFTWFDIHSESMFVGTMVFENGIRASLQVGGPDKDMEHGIRVIGTEGFIEVDWNGVILKAVKYNDPSWKAPQTELNSQIQMNGVIRNTLDCLESGEEPELSYKKALRASEVIFALFESVRRRERVELPLTGVTDHPLLTLLENGDLQR